MEFTRNSLFMLVIPLSLLFSLMLYLLLASIGSSQSELDRIIESARMAGKTFRDNSDTRITSMSFVKAHMEKLQTAIDFIGKDTDAEAVVKTEFYGLIVTLILTLLALIFVGSLVIPLVIAVAGGVLSFAGEISIWSDRDKKYKDFDKALPEFIQRIVLSMNAGYNLDKAMKVSARSLTGPAQPELQRFLIDVSKFSDDIAMPYRNLSERIPTDACKRFCSVVITGIRNGNPMRDVLSEEADYLNEELLTDLQSQGKKNETKSTAISTGFIFLPVIILMIAPIVATSL